MYQHDPSPDVCDIAEMIIAKQRSGPIGMSSFTGRGIHEHVLVSLNRTTLQRR
jgi:hypothetical protein